MFSFGLHKDGCYKPYKRYRAPRDRILKNGRRKEEMFLLRNQKKEEGGRLYVRYNHLRQSHTTRQKHKFLADHRG